MQFLRKNKKNNTCIVLLLLLSLNQIENVKYFRKFRLVE